MKKKYCIIFMTSLAVAVFGGCGANKTQVTEEQPVQEEWSEVSMQDNANKTQVTKELTQQNEVVGVCIDYVIENYKSIQNFSYELFEHNNDSTNPVLSPTSAYIALSMAGIGADGTTRKEFYDLLGEDMMTISDSLMNILPKSSENVNVSLANSVWINDQLSVNNRWLGEITSLMDAEAFQTDLSSLKAMDDINCWIEKKTNGMIDKMLTEPLDDTTELALFNTIFFKAKWVEPFDATSTYKGEFTIENGDIVETEMMRRFDNMDYISNDYAEGVILPYKNWQKEDEGNYAFVALKPKKQSDLSIRQMYNKLTPEDIINMLDNKQLKSVNLKLPKFEITFNKILNDSLQNMGLKCAFYDKLADFSLMCNNSDVYISLVCQKAKIIVDEDGTEAAAVTEAIFDKNAIIIQEVDEIELFFDEPFLYMIMDMDNNIPIFIGILDNPTVHD